MVPVLPGVGAFHDRRAIGGVPVFPQPAFERCRSMSDRDTWPDNPNDIFNERPVSGPREGWSGCFKVFLILGGLGFVTILLCCGAVGWFIKQSMPRMAKTPAEVSEVAGQIVKIDIPAGFVGESGMTIDNKLMTMRFAIFKQTQEKGMLMLGGFRVNFGDPAAQKGNFQSRKSQQSGMGEDLVVLKMESRDFTIRGQKVPFRFSEAEERNSKKKFRLVEGELDAPGGGAFIKLMLEEDAYDENAVVKMIESIQ
jgi:hypothetical protein